MKKNYISIESCMLVLARVIITMAQKVDGTKAARYYEEVIRLMNEIVALLQENNTILKQHNRTVDQLNQTVRKININTGNLK